MCIKKIFNPRKLFGRKKDKNTNPINIPINTEKKNREVEAGDISAMIMEGTLKLDQSKMLHMGYNLDNRYDSLYIEGIRNFALPRLNGISPNLESTCLKLMEEAGELAQLIGKERNLSGESNPVDMKELFDKIAGELIDVAQVAVSMSYVLEDQYGIDIEAKRREHIQKLKDKGYLV